MLILSAEILMTILNVLMMHSVSLHGAELVMLVFFTDYLGADALLKQLLCIIVASWRATRAAQVESMLMVMASVMRESGIAEHDHVGLIGLVLLLRRVDGTWL